MKQKVTAKFASLFFTAMLSILSIFFVAPQAHAEGAKPPVIATGGIEGSYYTSYGPNLAKQIAKAKVFNGDNFPQVIDTEGSLDNLNLVADGEANLALSQPDAFMYFRFDQPNKANRLVLLGNVPVTECVMMVVKKGGKTNGLDDLTKDSVVNIGVSGAGSQASWSYFGKLIPELKAVDTKDNTHTLAMGDVQTGLVDAMVFVSTKDVITELFEMVNAEGSGLKFVDIDDSRLDSKLPSGKPVYRFEEVDTGGGIYTDVEVPCMDLQIIASDKNDRKLNEATVRAIIRNGTAVAKVAD